MPPEARSHPGKGDPVGPGPHVASRGSQEWGNINMETLVYIIAILIVWALDAFVIYTLVKDIKEERRKSKISTSKR